MNRTTGRHELEFASATHVGKSRSENQDRCSWFETSQAGSYIIIVADGMGGHFGGGIAAEIAVESVRSTFGRSFTDPKKTLKSSFDLAHKGLTDRAGKDSMLKNMGCTLSVALYYDNLVYTAHIGDSRIYRIGHGHIDQLSEDHSLVQEMVKQGAIKLENARAHPKANILLRALTTNPDCELDVYQPVTVKSNDVFLVCSDGLWNMIEDNEIRDIVTNNSAVDAVQYLIQRANEFGGKDNIAASIMRII